MIPELETGSWLWTEMVLSAAHMYKTVAVAIFQVGLFLVPVFRICQSLFFSLFFLLP